MSITLVRTVWPNTLLARFSRAPEPLALLRRVDAGKPDLVLGVRLVEDRERVAVGNFHDLAADLVVRLRREAEARQRDQENECQSDRSAQFRFNGGVSAHRQLEVGARRRTDCTRETVANRFQRPTRWTYPLTELEDFGLGRPANVLFSEYVTVLVARAVIDAATCSDKNRSTSVRQCSRSDQSARALAVRRKRPLRPRGQRQAERPGQKGTPPPARLPRTGSDESRDYSPDTGARIVSAGLGQRDSGTPMTKPSNSAVMSSSGFCRKQDAIEYVLGLDRPGDASSRRWSGSQRGF
jgi:hypothetical protein